jgi:hypothetical protein
MPLSPLLLFASGIPLDQSYHGMRMSVTQNGLASRATVESEIGEEQESEDRPADDLAGWKSR